MGRNYGTCVVGDSGETDGLKYQAATNIAILNAFLEATPANVAIIQEQIKVTYIQAALRYLNKMDNDLMSSPVAEHREHQGEGYAFFKVGEAYLGDEIAAVIEGLYLTDVDTTATYAYDATTFYCRGLAALATQAAAGDIGTLDDADSDQQ